VNCDFFNPVNFTAKMLGYKATIKFFFYFFNSKIDFFNDYSGKKNDTIVVDFWHPQNRLFSTNIALDFYNYINYQKKKKKKNEAQKAIRGTI